nr:reverse transcriptase domain-containing protein [Tanacetum cinerariifolium]
MPPKNTTTPMTDVVIKQLIAQGVANALVEYKATRNIGNGDYSRDSGSSRRTERATPECTYSDFLKWQPLNFKGTEGVIGLTQWGLPDMIQGSVMASKPKTMQDAIEIANDLINQKIRTFAERQCENKRKLDNNNKAQQKPPKKQNVAWAYSTGDYKSLASTENQKTLTCYECRNQGRYSSDYPEIKNRNHENQAEGTEARRMVYALRGRETDQDLDNMEDDINA